MSERIREMLQPVLSPRELTVFDIERKGPVVLITLDKPEGQVAIEDCVQVSKFLTHALEVDDIIPGNYRLEVSSPGLNRPLRSAEEFQRFVGKLCRITLVDAEGGDHVVVGRIDQVDSTQVQLDIENGETRQVPMANIARARLKVEF